MQQNHTLAAGCCPQLPDFTEGSFPNWHIDSSSLKAHSRVKVCRTSLALCSAGGVKAGSQHTAHPRTTWPFKYQLANSQMSYRCSLVYSTFGMVQPEVYSMDKRPKAVLQTAMAVG